MRLRGIGLLVTLAVDLLAAPLAAEAQQAGRVPRIGVLANIRSPATEGFERGLKELGYIEGKNIIIEWRLAEGKFDRLPDLAAELVRLKVDVILAPATPYVQTAKNATKTIPIVFALVPDPVAAGFVAGLGRPGGNITGLTSTAGPEIVGKRLELLKETVPEITRVAVLSNPADPLAVASLRDMQMAGRSLGVQVQVVEVRDPKELDGAFSSITKQGGGGVVELAHVMFYAERKRIAELAVKNRLPTMYAYRESVDAGGFVCYAANFPDLMRRAATYVDKILKGAKPADLPVEQPTKFEFVINLKTAKALGLTIPQSILIRADEVIQ